MPVLCLWYFHITKWKIVHIYVYFIFIYIFVWEYYVIFQSSYNFVITFCLAKDYDPLVLFEYRESTLKMPVVHW